MSEHHQHGADSPDMGADFWNERYASAPAIWSGRPNPQLVAEAAALAPGRALDVGSGEGADAIWLAQRGWTVTAVDISTVALERAQEHARQAGDDVAGRITWQQADITAWTPPPSSFDLVSAQFLHVPTAGRAALNGALASAVAAGGALLVVGHHPLDLETTVRRPSRADLMFTAEETLGALNPADWEVLAAEARPRMVADAEGSEVTVHDAVLFARRRG